jgi:hypothetical protein
MVKKLAIIGLLVVALTMVNSGLVVAASPLHKASGGGTNVGYDGAIRTVAFTAIQVNETGDAKGQLMVLNRKQEVELHCSILYLKVDGNQAWVGGVITQSSDPVFRPVGWEFVLRVLDNGEGANKAVDRSSYITFDYHGKPVLASQALEMLPLDWYVWPNGNIQVK